MKNLVIAGIALFVILIGVVYMVAGSQVDMTEDFVNTMSMLAAVFILGISIAVGLKYVNQMKNDKASGQLAEENWDGIGEYKNELPIGWALSFLGTIIWALWYWTTGYPVNAYSQIGEWNEEVSEYQSKFESKWAGADHSTLKSMGESLFLVQCAPCHGETADGMGGKAADLNVWGREQAIVDTIVKGSKGLNYPMGEMPAGLVDAQTAKAIAAYVMAEVSEKKHTKHPELVETGKAMWSVCAGCHGADGAGMGGMAPDLTGYGTPKFVSAVLERGKKGMMGHMPSFRGRFSDIQEKAVGTYILSLGQ